MAHDDIARLQALLDTLDRGGVHDAFPESTALLDRALEVERAADVQASAAARLRADLVLGVLDKGLSLEEAGRRLSEVSAWLPTAPAAGGQRRGRTPGDAVAGPVALNLRNRAVQAARSAQFDVHKALAGRAAGFVKRGVAAGKQLIDVPGVATALTPPKWDRPPDGTWHYPVPGRQLHPWLSHPPVLPTLDFADVQRDPVRVTAWAEAADAHAQLLALHDLAGEVHAMTGGSSTLYAPGTVDRDALAFLTEGLPVVVHLAVTDALGWKPGLHTSLKPAPIRMPAAAEDKMEGWATPAQQQTAVRLLSRLGIR